MATYVYMGSGCEIGDLKFDEKGQRAEFTPEMYDMVSEGGAVFVPEGEVDFTQEEFALLHSSYLGEIPEDLQKKVDDAHQKFRDHVAILSAAKA